MEGASFCAISAFKLAGTKLQFLQGLTRTSVPFQHYFMGSCGGRGSTLPESSMTGCTGRDPCRAGRQTKSGGWWLLLVNTVQTNYRFGYVGVRYGCVAGALGVSIARNGLAPVKMRSPQRARREGPMNRVNPQAPDLAGQDRTPENFRWLTTCTTRRY